MKFVIALLYLLTITQASAHPRDRDPLSTVDEGSTFTALVDINIPSLQGPGFIDGLRLETEEVDAYLTGAIDKPMCRLFALEKNGYLLKRDALLKKGSILVLTENNRRRDPNRGDLQIIYQLYFKTPADYVTWLVCFHDYKSSGKEVSIGDMKSALKDLFSLTLAPPLELVN